MIEPLIPLPDNAICGEGMCEEDQKALAYPVTAAGLSANGYLIAEREVVGLIPWTGPKLCVLK